MPRFPSLPEDPDLVDVFRRFPASVHPLLEYHDRLLRGPSPLSRGQRELLAAYVSGLNRCQYCFDVHRDVADAFGLDPELARTLLEHPEAADEHLRPLLAYVRKLTETPARMTDADARAVFDAGWSEEALHDAVAICGLFNLMNRMVEGMGVKPNSDMMIPREAAAGDHTYTGLARIIGLE